MSSLRPKPKRNGFLEEVPLRARLVVRRGFLDLDLAFEVLFFDREPLLRREEEAVFLFATGRPPLRRDYSTPENSARATMCACRDPSC